MNYDEWFEILNKNRRTTYFLGKEVEVSKEAWDFQQKKIDKLQAKVDEVLIKHGEEVLNTLIENGYVILPTDLLSEEDTKQRKTPNISFIVKLTHLEKLNDGL